MFQKAIENTLKHERDWFNIAYTDEENKKIKTATKRSEFFIKDRNTRKLLHNAIALQ